MNLTVRNNIGEQFNIVVIRYFNFNGGNYLIFTRNEMDEAGYQKLYISKIVNMVGNDIDDNEWNLVRDTIKVIAKANKENTSLPVQDMNEAEVNGIQILGQKPFKLTTSSVALLGANKSVQNNIESVIPDAVSSPAASPQVAPVAAVPLFENNITPAPVMDAVMPVNQPQMSMPSVPTGANVPNVPVPAAPFTVEPMNVAPVNSTSVVEPVAPMQEVAVPTPPVEPVPFAPVESLVPNFGESSDMVISNAIEPGPAPVAPFAVEPMNAAPVNSNPVVESIAPMQEVAVPQAPIEPVAPVASVALGNVTESVDYKKLYEDQTLKLNNLTAELDKYKGIVEQLKNILN